MLIVGKLLNTGYGQFPMKNMQDLHLAIVGATGAVGREVVRILERRELFPKTIRFSASAKSASQTIDFKGKPIAVEELDGDFFKGIDVAICSAGSSVSQKWVIPEVLKKTIATTSKVCFNLDFLNRFKIFKFNLKIQNSCSWITLWAMCG
jgi:aspartate-semialdehyde dehydrogenase